MADQPTGSDSEAAAAAIGENLQTLGAQWQHLFQSYVKQMDDTEKCPSTRRRWAMAF